MKANTAKIPVFEGVLRKLGFFYSQYKKLLWTPHKICADSQVWHDMGYSEKSKLENALVSCLFTTNSIKDCVLGISELHLSILYLAIYFILIFISD